MVLLINIGEQDQQGECINNEEKKENEKRFN